MADIKSNSERGSKDAPPRLDTPFREALMWGLGKGNSAGVEGPKITIPSLPKSK